MERRKFLSNLSMAIAGASAAYEAAQGGQQMGYPKLTPITSTGSTEPRYLGDRFADIVNVIDFGAKGDGTTDDTLALQAAFDHAYTLGGAHIIFPPGVYRVSSVVKTGGNIVVYAYGATIRATGSESMFSMIQNTLGYTDSGPSAFSGNSNIYWNGGTIDGDGQNADADTARQCMMFMHSENCHVKDVVFKNARRVHTLEFATARNCSVVNCSFLGQYPPRTDLLPNYFPEVVQINCTGEDETPGWYGDNVECSDLLFEDCLFTNAENSRALTDSSPFTGVGAHGSHGEETVKNITIKNCTFRSLRKIGVSCRWTDFENWRIESCIFDSIGLRGAEKTNAVYVFNRDNNVKSSGFYVLNCLFTDVSCAFSISGNENNEANDISVCGNIAKTDNMFGVFGYINSFYIQNNIYKLSANQQATDTCCLYIANSKNGTVNAFTHDDGAFTNVHTDTVRAASGCENVKFLNVFSNTLGYNSIGHTQDAVNGMSGRYSGPQIFKAFQGKTSDGIPSNGAPAIGLITPYNYFAPQIGFKSSEGFNIGAYTDDGSLSKYVGRILYIKAGPDYGVCPGTNNEQSSGAASNKWSVVYAGTGSINTSDERQKDNIETPSEAVFRAWSKVRVKVFQFKDAIAKKGGKARLHVGIIAQDVKKAFAEEGLDASRYSLFCFDKWDAEVVDRLVTDVEAVLDNNGLEVIPAKTHIEKIEVSPAGESYGIRYEEALALECAYQRWRLEQLEERVNQLTNNSNK